MANHIIVEIINILRNIKFDKNLSDYKGKLINDLKLKERIIFGNQFFVAFDLQQQEIINTHANIREIAGLIEDSLTIKDLLNFINSDDLDLVLKAVNLILNEGLKNQEHKPLDDVYCMHFRFNKFNGETIWVKCEISTFLKDKTGIPFLAYIQFTDITESSEPKEFKLFYTGLNCKCINFPVGRSLKYKKWNCLTEREKEILLLIIDGNTNKKIAQILDIGIGTVNSHRTNILIKTGQHNTAGLINWAKHNL